MQTQLEELNPWWKNKNHKLDFIKRKKYTKELEKQFDRKDVVILTGLRRVGKTTILKTLISSLLAKKIPAKKIFFISLDMLYFSEFTIQEIVLEYKKINSIPHGEKLYLFLDEITYKKDFNQELKNLYDLGNYKIFASSSSASVLKDNKAFLTGRSKYLEINPLDFEEFLLFNGKEIEKTDKHILSKLFEEYMEFGGMPEYVLTKDPQYLSELVEVIITKDIIAEKNIKNHKAVFDLYRLLCERVGKQISYNKLSKILNIDNETISRYISHFLNTYLFDIIEVKGKLNQKIKSNKKLYCVDIGMRNIITGLRDLGAIYENLVYNKIKQNSPSFIYENGIEIDFCFNSTLIEAKFGQKLKDKQKDLFDKLQYKTKIIANGIDFFLK